MPYTAIEVNPLPSQEFERSIGHAQEHAPFETMQSNGAGHLVAGDFRACMNDQAGGFERFGFDDCCRSRMFQALPERPQIDDFSSTRMMHRHFVAPNAASAPEFAAAIPAVVAL